MIIVTWRVSTAPEGAKQGLEWGNKVMAGQKKAGLAPSKWWILRPRSGDFSRFTMAAQFASLAEFEAHEAKRDADSGFQAMIKEREEADWYAGVEVIIAEVVEEG